MMFTGMNSNVLFNIDRVIIQSLTGHIHLQKLVVYLFWGARKFYIKVRKYLPYYKLFSWLYLYVLSLINKIPKHVFEESFMFPLRKLPQLISLFLYSMVYRPLRIIIILFQIFSKIAMSTLKCSV